MKAAICVVLGMHRGGTSAITRGINALGVSLGADLLPPVPDNNETGFWEDKEIFEFNEQLLAAMDEHWCSVRLYDGRPGELPELPALLTRARELLGSRLAPATAFGFKDPRTVRLLSFWSRVFDSLDLLPKYVIAVRNPLSVAQSLLKRDGLRESQSYLLWLQHMLGALQWTEGFPRVVVDYDRVLSNPTEELLRIRSALNLPNQADIELRLDEYSSRFLRADLRHTYYADEAIDDASEVPPSVSRLHRLLVDLAKDEITFNDPKCKRQIQQLWASLNDFSTAFSLAETSLAEESRLKELLRAKESDSDKQLGQMRDLESKLRAASAELEQRTQLAQEVQTQLNLSEQRRGNLQQTVADISTSLRTLWTSVREQASRFRRLEELVRRNEHHTAELERIQERQVAELENERSRRLLFEQELATEKERSQTISNAHAALEKLVDYERRRGLHAEKLYQASRIAAEVAGARLDEATERTAAIEALGRENLERLEYIEGGSFWRCTRGVRAVWHYVEKTLLRRNLAFQMSPSKDLQMLGRKHAWRATGDDPNFELVPFEGGFPRGWIFFTTSVQAACSHAPKLYLDFGEGYSEHLALHLPVNRQGRVGKIVHFRAGLKALRWYPVDAPGEFLQGPIFLSEIGPVERVVRMLVSVVRTLRTFPEGAARDRNLTWLRAVTDLPRVYEDVSDLIVASPARRKDH